MAKHRLVHNGNVSNITLQQNINYGTYMFIKIKMNIGF